jgi:hypothetical protein
MHNLTERSAARPRKDGQTTQFDIHGVLGIALVDPSPADLKTVTKHLGPLQGPLLHEPDITIRFDKNLVPLSLRHLGQRQNGFTDDAFFVFDETDSRAMAKIPFDQVGRPCEIVCTRGRGSVPLLLPLLSLTALAKDFVAVHASAFVHHGVGILMAGWAGSGKTTALLGFAGEGAEFVGEEWVLLSGDGQTMCGLPREFELSPAHLDTVPKVRHAIKRSRLWALEGLRHFSTLQDLLAGKVDGTTHGKALRRVISGAQRRILPKASPQAFFGSRVASLTARPDKIFLLISHDDRKIEVIPTPPGEMARRIAHMMQYEQQRFMEHYLAFQFAFPERRNIFIEESSSYRYELLLRALQGKETYTLRHPHPIPFSSLYEAVKSFCETTTNIQTEVVCAVP